MRGPAFPVPFHLSPAAHEEGEAMARSKRGARGFPAAVAVAAALAFLAVASGAALGRGGGGGPAGISQVTERRGEAGFRRNEWLLGTAEEAAFVSFARRYNKEYATREEYLYRLGVFARNAVRAAEHQALDPTAVHGVTPFSDLTEEEFERQFTGLQARGEDGSAGRGCGGGGGSGEMRAAAPDLDVMGLPSNFDWREKGAVTEVKMQIFSNGMYKSLLHRVSVNTTRARMSVACLHALPAESIVRPSPRLVDDENPRRYMDTDFAAFLQYLSSRETKGKNFLESRKLASKQIDRKPQ